MSEEPILSDIENDAGEAIAAIVPEKSRHLYESAYTRFHEWRQPKKDGVS